LAAIIVTLAGLIVMSLPLLNVPSPPLRTSLKVAVLIVSGSMGESNVTMIAAGGPPLEPGSGVTLVTRGPVLPLGTAICADGLYGVALVTGADGLCST
jgi:hypothetical protein